MMAESRTATEASDLKRHVQELLDEACGELGFRLRVSDDGYEEAGWLYFDVEPDREGVRAYEFADALSQVELKLRRDEGIERVLLVPAREA